MPGATTLMRFGVISDATARRGASTAAPPADKATCPDFILRAGVPLTRTMHPFLLSFGAPNRMTLL
jgi:hypothetical protein